MDSIQQIVENVMHHATEISTQRTRIRFRLIMTEGRYPVF